MIWQRGGSANKQAGVALISVLLVFALAAMIAAQVVSRNYRDIRRTANMINSKQAYYYALGGEQFAKQLLYRDYSSDAVEKTDTLTDLWAQKLESFDIDNGNMQVEIIDLQSRFNINNLAYRNNRAFIEFRRLLNVLAINTDYSNVLQDWLDSDSVVLSGGAEDDTYLLQRNAYLAGNQNMADRTELRLLSELTIEDYTALQQYVVALPTATKYNINTLDAKVLASLSNQLSAGDIAQIQRQQQQGGHRSVAQWFNASAAKKLAPLQSQLTVHSEYFEVIVTVNYEKRSSIIRTQLFRDNNSGQIRVIKRQQGFE